MPIRHKVPDPIHGYLTMPDWLIETETIPSIRRMLGIRQLGLKSYIDFPGAIHTRYGHGLGTMHLAGLLVDQLAQKEQDKGNKKISKNLVNNKNNLMAAGFLHDIAHGPFSHAVDFVMEQTSSITHEKLAAEIINGDLKKSLEKHGITTESVIKIINKDHDFKFISGVINGPLDVDKLDYLLRDAHHVGLKYGFDLEHFVDSYTVLGNDDDLSECVLGLDDTLEAQVTGEIFVLIWKSMYDLVYYVRDSRIAEKMLEKAVLVGVKNDPILKDYFSNTKKLVTLDDDKLFNLLENSNQIFSQKIVEGIRNRKLFEELDSIKLYENKEIDPKFITKISAAKSSETNEISDILSKKICEKLGLNDYQIICDIVTTRVPSNIYINKTNPETGEPFDLKNRSDIIKAMKQRSTLRVYLDPESKKIIAKDLFSKEIKKIMKDEGGA